MKGTEVYNKKYDRMSKNIIKTAKKEWMLSGFYNSMIIKNTYSTAYVNLCHVASFLNSIQNVKDITIDDYYAYLASQKDKKQTSQICVFHALQKYSRYLKARGICEDYMSYVERPQFYETQDTKDRREHGYLTKEEAKVALGRTLKGDHYNKGECWSKRDYAIFMILLTTGIRCSALYKMDVEDVDFGNNTISVFEKGNKPRVITITQDTADAIHSYLLERRMLSDLSRSEHALMISKRRTRMTQQSIGNVVRKACGMSPHKLRATYGTEVYSAKKDLYLTQECMGHSSPQVTELYIRGQKNEVTKKAADIMSSFLSQYF